MPTPLPSAFLCYSLYVASFESPAVFKQLQDSMIQWGVSRVLKKGVAMTQIKIDRHAKTMELELELEGESTPIRIKVDRNSDLTWSI